MKKILKIFILLSTVILIFVTAFKVCIYNKNILLHHSYLKTINSDLLFVNKNGDITVYNVQNDSLYTIDTPFSYPTITNISDNLIELTSSDKQNENYNITTVIDFNGEIVSKSERKTENYPYKRYLSENFDLYINKNNKSTMYIYDKNSKKVNEYNIPEKIYDSFIPVEFHNGFIYYSDYHNVSNGKIYRYNLETKTNEIIYDKGSYTTTIFYKNYLYIHNNFSQEIYAVNLSTTKLSKLEVGFVDLEYVICNDVIYFTKSSTEPWIRNNENRIIYKAHLENGININEIKKVFK